MAAKMLESWRKYGLFASLYFAQGMPEGFIGGALLNHLYREGLSKQAGAMLLAVVALPWTFKVVWAPLVDRVDLLQTRLGRRYTWLLHQKRFAWMVVSTLVMMLALLMLAWVESWYVGVMVVVFAHNVARSFQDVATDGMAIGILEKKERAPAQAAMRAAQTLGGIVAGSGVIYFSKTLPWGLFCVIVVCFIAITGLLIPWLLMPRKAGQVEKDGHTTWRELIVSFKGAATIMLVMAALLAHVAEGLTAPIIFPWLQKDLGYLDEWIGVVDFATRWAKFGGIIVAGFVARWFYLKRALLVTVGFKAASYFALGAFAGFWGSKELVLGLALATSVADGLFVVLFCTFLMGYCKAKAAATQFAVFMALMNLCGTWTAATGGWLSGHLSSAGMFMTGGACQLLIILPLMFIKRSPEVER